MAAAASFQQQIPPFLTLRVPIVGDANCGKTALVRRFIDDDFHAHSAPTIGAEFSGKIFQPAQLDNGPQLDKDAQAIFAKLPVKIVAVDMPGQDSLASVTPMALRNADACFICYDITNPASYQNAETWHRKILRHSPQAMCIMVACKCDLEDERAISNSDADIMAKSKNMMLFETSAKDDKNVIPTFRFVANSMRQRWYANLAKANPRKLEERVRNVNLGADASQNGSKAARQPEKKCCL